MPALKAACPNGVDVYFENVGGAVFAAILRVINKGARIPLCGIISEYNATGNPAGPNLRPLLVQRAMIKGFIVSDHNDRAPAFLQEVAPLVMSGRIKYREDIVDGLDNAPAAFIGLLHGQELRQADGPRVARPDARLITPRGLTRRLEVGLKVGLEVARL